MSKKMTIYSWISMTLLVLGFCYEIQGIKLLAVLMIGLILGYKNGEENATQKRKEWEESHPTLERVERMNAFVKQHPDVFGDLPIGDTSDSRYQANVQRLKQHLALLARQKEVTREFLETMKLLNELGIDVTENK